MEKQEVPLDASIYDGPPKEHLDTSELSLEEDGVPTIDPKIEKKILRKCDFRVLPPVVTLFLVTFFDRVNIGNAIIQGLPEELNMRGTEINVAILIIFIPFILFEIPENMILKKTKPYQWLSFLTFMTGIMNMCMGFVHSYGALVGVRFLLGVFESGLGAGCVFVISSYYKRHELSSRLAIWYLSGIGGAAFASLLSYGIVRMDGDAGISGWRWIFIIEGSIAAFIGILVYFWMVDWPDRANFLTTEEREILIHRLRSDRSTEQSMERWNTKRLFGDWRIWLGTLMYACALTMAYSFTFFFPTILVEMGFGPITAQLYAFIPYAVSMCTTLLICNLSDYFKHRYGFLMGGVLIGVVGYGILLSQKSNPGLPVGAKYFALFPLTIGAFTVQPMSQAWMMNNVGGRQKRAFASACQIGFGNAGGLIASNIFFSEDAPFFTVGFAVCLSMLLLCGVLATVLLVLVKRENRLKAEGKKDHLLHGPEADNLGDDHPEFIYTY